MNPKQIIRIPYETFSENKKNLKYSHARNVKVPYHVITNVFGEFGGVQQLSLGWAFPKNMYSWYFVYETKFFKFRNIFGEVYGLEEENSILLTTDWTLDVRSHNVKDMKTVWYEFRNMLMRVE